MTTSAVLTATATLQLTDVAAWIPAALGALLVLATLVTRPTLKAVPVRVRRAQRRHGRR